MKIPTVSELVKGDKIAGFVRCDFEGTLWYAVDSFEFPITKSEAKGGSFHRDERAITLMRWIRKHVAYLNAAWEASQGDEA